MKISLTFQEKLKYYKVSLILIIVGLWCLLSGIEDSTFEYYKFGTIEKIGSAIIALGIINIVFLEKSLYYKKYPFQIEKSEFKDRLLELVERKEWTIKEIKSDYYILKTHRFDKYERNDFLRKNYSERIYIKINFNKIYFKSINDFDSDIAVRISSGENTLNENLLKKVVMPAANNA